YFPWPYVCYYVFILLQYSLFCDGVEDEVVSAADNLQDVVDNRERRDLREDGVKDLVGGVNICRRSTALRRDNQVRRERSLVRHVRAGETAADSTAQHSSRK